MRKFSVALLLATVCGVNAQLPYKYRVFLTDKNENKELLKSPEKLLSVKALARRGHHGVLVDTTDLPVSATYINRLAEAGFPFVCASRWLNSVVVSSSDSVATEMLQALPFVKEAKLVWKDNMYQPSFFVSEEETGKRAPRDNSDVFLQLTAHHGDQLHNAGYRGEGMQIAVIDAGFLNADKIAAYAGKILGTRDFVDPKSDIYATHPHGETVLSVMAYPADADFAGTAPGASYWLLRSEDSSSEYPVEEDYWAAAAEYADSLGVDIINSSLGYNVFDDVRMNYTTDQLDGKSAFITQAASMAASKGILVVNSAGNDGARLWRRISFPSDSPDILTVGAVNPKFNLANFSGQGFVSKGFVKPNVVGLGSPAYYINTDGNLVSGSGTSYSTPAIAGLAACLWQSLPELKNNEVIRLLETYGSQSQSPDSLMGYGLPDVYRAFTQTTPIENIRKTPLQLVPIDTTAQLWKLSGAGDEPLAGNLRVFNTTGELRLQFSFAENNPVFNLKPLEKGLYIITVQTSTVRFSQQIHLTGK